MTVGNGDKLNGTLRPDNGSTELVNGFADQRFMISKYKLHILIHITLVPIGNVVGCTTSYCGSQRNWDADTKISSFKNLCSCSGSAESLLTTNM